MHSVLPEDDVKYEIPHRQKRFSYLLCSLYFHHKLKTLRRFSECVVMCDTCSECMTFVHLICDINIKCLWCWRIGTIEKRVSHEIEESKEGALKGIYVW